jgi:hypothetical protein
MDYTNDPTGTKGTNGTKANTKPNYHDYEELAAIYAHGDSNTTVSSAASTNFGVRQVGRPVPQQTQGAGDTMAEWGQAVRNDGNGRPDMFIKQVGSLKMITHVLWAPDATGAEAR